MTDDKTIAESNHFIVLDKYNKEWKVAENDQSEGLPREIALRQQQYECYRDLLLSFPKPEEAAA